MEYVQEILGRMGHLGSPLVISREKAHPEQIHIISFDNFRILYLVLMGLFPTVPNFITTILRLTYSQLHFMDMCKTLQKSPRLLLRKFIS